MKNETVGVLWRHQAINSETKFQIELTKSKIDHLILDPIFKFISSTILLVIVIPDFVNCAHQNTSIMKKINPDLIQESIF